MELLFLGTGAADFLPSLTDTDRFTVDKDIRRSTVTLLNREVLIDCGPHLMDELQIHHVDAKKIRHILITHPHSDHFNPDCLRTLAIHHPIHVWHSQDWKLPQIEHVTEHPMQIGQRYRVGRFSVTPLAANHDAGALHFSICGDKKRVFYGCDGAWLLHDTYYYMRKKQYDCMILDATVGDYEGDYRMAEHNSIPMIRSMCKSLLRWEAMNADTKIVLDHLARTLHKSHADTCQRVAQDGYMVAFDGMVLEI